MYGSDAAYVVPSSEDEAFLPTMLEICGRESVSLLVPTRDAELPFFAGHAKEFDAVGCRVLVSSPSAVETCQDKLAFLACCEAHGVSTPRAYLGAAEPDRFPVFARPVRAAGGHRSGVVRTSQELADLRSVDPNLLVQEFISAPEYSVDVLCDFDGVPVQAVARARLRIRAGEAVISRVTENAPLEILATKLCQAIGVIGHAVVQAFLDPLRGPLAIEINPRFGGASNLSIAAGLDSPRRLLGLLAGEAESRRPRPIAYGLTMLRFSDDILLAPNKLLGSNAPSAPV